jgi:hypothetical protein
MKNKTHEYIKQNSTNFKQSFFAASRKMNESIANSNPPPQSHQYVNLNLPKVFNAPIAGSQSNSNNNLSNSRNGAFESTNNTSKAINLFRPEILKPISNNNEMNHQLEKITPILEAREMFRHI